MSIKRLVVLFFNCAVIALVFLVPSNLFLKFSLNSAYVRGLLVDYLIPKLYLSDLALISVMLSGSYLAAVSGKFKFKLPTNPAVSLALAFGLVLTVWQLLSLLPLVSLVYWLKLILIGYTAWLMISLRRFISVRAVLIAVGAAILFQSGLAIYQFHTQQSVFGYSLLGEPQLWPTIGLAKTQLGGVERILPYGTTTHPNVLGGFLSLYLLCVLSCVFTWPKHHSKLQLVSSILILGLGGYALLLTQSFSAILTFVLGTIWLLINAFFSLNKRFMAVAVLVVSLVIFIGAPVFINLANRQYPDQDSLRRRNYLQEAAINMIGDQPLFGVGLNQFTTRVEEYSSNPEVVRFVQPVHHVGLLWLAETGIVGLLFLLSCVYVVKKTISPIIMLTVLASLDHYLLTQQSGLLIVLMTVTLCAGVFQIPTKVKQKDWAKR